MNKIQSRDKEKIELCKSNNVILIEIPALGPLLKIKDLEKFIFSKLSTHHIYPETDRPIVVDWKNIYNSEENEKLNKMIETAKSYGGELLSMEFKGLKEKYLWKCKENHTWKAVAQDIVGGQKSWCGICSKRVKHGIKKLKGIVESKGGTLLSKRYFNAHHKYRIVCKDGHEWRTTASNLINKKYWCPKCDDKKVSVCCVKILCIENNTVYNSVIEAAKILGLSRPNISAVLNGSRKSHGGLTFKYYKP